METILNPRAFASLVLVAIVAASTLSCDRGANGDPSAPRPPADRDPTPVGADPAITAVHVTGGIHMLVGRGGNIGVSVGDDGILLIDDKFAPLADDIRAALRALHPGDVAYVLNTHHHGDHTGGNDVFGEHATIVAHDNVRKRLAGADRIARALPVITFDASLTVHVNGEAIRAVHFDHAHTDGDSVIFFDKSNVVHMGDLMFNGRFPYVDLDSGGDPVKLAAHSRSVLGMIGPDTRIIPGHGDLATRADLDTYIQMLDDTTGSVREQIAQGKTLAQIQKAGVRSRWSSWGAGFISTDRWLATLHRALTR